MKTKSYLLSFLPLLLLAAVVGASVPLPLDPVKVAPHIFAEVINNERVRVIQQTIRNGEFQPVHGHPDRVQVYLQSCAWLERDADGKEQMQLFRIGEVHWAAADTHGGRTAAVVQECKIIEIELK